MKKKVLILGGKPLGSCEITQAAKKRGYHTIVTDYLKVEESPAKQISDEYWNLSTADVNELCQKCKEDDVSAVLTGVHEFNIEKKIEICEKLNIPQYCTMEQWKAFDNKKQFKEYCVSYGIDVAKTYTVKDAAYPVIVKPTDSSGSRGFSICNNQDELIVGIELALSFSPSGEYLIEEFFDCEACVVHYTAIDGDIVFCGMSDKHSQILRGGSSVMALQTFPSASTERYLKSVNEKAISMFKDLGVKNGPIWIEVFNDIKTGRFVFNEMGFRFGGSLTNYPVKHLYGIDQLDLMISNALGESSNTYISKEFKPETTNYCIFPIHLVPGVIKEISSVNEIEKIEGVVKLAQVHYIGDEILEWGTTRQVFCYLHIAYNSVDELKQRLNQVKKKLSVIDINGAEMIYYLYDLSKLGVD